MTKPNPKSCVIITTINSESRALRSFSAKKGYDLIIVGDKKSPKKYNLKATYLDVQKQKDSFSKFANLLPYNHYARKNIGYLYGLREGYDIIADSDDDNIPLSGWGIVPPNMKYDVVVEPRFPNMYNFFTSEKIWPRGYPLNHIAKPLKTKLSAKTENVLVWQGLVNGDPDVDAIHRLLFNKEIIFNERSHVTLAKGVVSAFNSQNTLWHRKALLYAYLPHTVSFRYTDILRSFVAQYGIWQLGGRVGFHSATAKQVRNPHNLLTDLHSEHEMHMSFHKVIDALDNCKLTGAPSDLLIMYTALYKIGVVKKEELISVKEWIRLFKILKK